MFQSDWLLFLLRDVAENSEEFLAFCCKPNYPLISPCYSESCNADDIYIHLKYIGFIYSIYPGFSSQSGKSRQIFLLSDLLVDHLHVTRVNFPPVRFSTRQKLTIQAMTMPRFLHTLRSP